MQASGHLGNVGKHCSSELRMSLHDSKECRSAVKTISTHVAIVLFLLATMTVVPAAACTVESAYPSRVVMGYTVYSETLWTTTGPSGRILSAYAGIYAGSLEECLRKCEADAECSGITKRPSEFHGPRTCLKFSRTDYETGERGRMFYGNIGGRGHDSAIVRRGSGEFCNM